LLLLCLRDASPWARRHRGRYDAAVCLPMRSINRRIAFRLDADG